MADTGSPGRWWRDLYGWLGTEAAHLAGLDDLLAGNPDRAAISAQAHELRFVREHMRQMDPALTPDESDQE